MLCFFTPIIAHITLVAVSLARKEAPEGTLARDFTDYWFQLFGKGRFKQDPQMSNDNVTIGYLMDNLWIVGNPDDVAKQLCQLYQEVSGFGMLLAVGHEWFPRQAWIHSMTLLKPKLTDLNGN